MGKSNTFNRTLSDFTIPINDITISYRDSNSFEQTHMHIVLHDNKFLTEPLRLKISLEGSPVSALPEQITQASIKSLSIYTDGKSKTCIGIVMDPIKEVKSGTDNELHIIMEEEDKHE